MWTDLDIKRLPNGDLEIRLDDKESREWLSDVIGDRPYWSIMSELFESHSCNGSYTPFDAGDGDPFVGLTGAPCIAESMDYHDDGKREIIGDLWYFDRYMLEDPLEQLAVNGVTVYQLAR